MFSTRTLISRIARPSRTSITTLPQSYIRTFSNSSYLYAKDPKMSSSPPKHEMVYFPGMTSEVRSFGQFRKVMHTGLYSQLVTMEIPVGGDIGDEVHTVDQVLIFTSGEGKATIAGKDQVSGSSSRYITPSPSMLILTYFLGHQSLRRRRRASRNPAPVHQHVQDAAAGVDHRVQPSRAR